MGVPFVSDGWRGLAASPELAVLFTPLDSFRNAHPGEAIVHYDSRDVRRITLPPRSDASAPFTVYCKEIRALTDAGFHGRELFSQCKWLFRPSRAVAAFRISEALLAAGLACAEPLLAVRRRHRGVPTDLFITREVPYPDLWQEPALPPEELAHFLAVQTIRMHRCGFAHGDYILRNLCYNPAGSTLILLDNDRTWRPPAFVRRHYFQRNLAQLCYSLMRRFGGDSPAPARFLTDYAELSRSSAPEACHRILTQCLQRLHRRYPR